MQNDITADDLRRILPHASEGVIKRNCAHSEHAPEYRTDREAKEKACEAAERELQAAVESWLVARGYGRRTPKKMQRHTETRWMVHLNRPKDNPLLLDILLLWHWPDDPPGHNEALELELKVEGGQLSPDQKHLILTQCGALAWNMEQAKSAVLLWERAVYDRKQMQEQRPGGKNGEL